MEEKELIIISIIENEFNNLSINNLINELKKIPQYDFKKTRTFILKLFRDIDTAIKNSKNRIKKYFQSLKPVQNEQLIKKIYFQSRNKPLLSKYNTKESTIKNENLLYQNQTNNKDYFNYENIQSIQNLKSSDENSPRQNDYIFNKDILEMKYFSGNNGIKGGGLKIKKKIELENKSLSEFKIKAKQKINLNGNYNKGNYNLYELYNKAHYNKNNSKDKSNSINNNKFELSLNNKKIKENNYFSNIKIIKQIKKKIPSYDKKIINKNDSNLLNTNIEKIDNFNRTEEIKKYNSKIINYKINKKINEQKKPSKNQNDKKEKEKENLLVNTLNNDLTEDNNFNLAKDIINFIENMKDLQKNIINKNPNIKEMKYNFEKNKYLLYQKALKLLKEINNQNYIKVNLKFNKNNEISQINSFSIGRNKIVNNKPNEDNTKELNLSIINLKKNIEDIKNNSKFITEKLNSEISDLNGKLKEKIEKEKEYENNMKEYLISVKKIYELLMNFCTSEYQILNTIENKSVSSVNSPKKTFYWHVDEITKYIEIMINKNKEEKKNLIKEEIPKINKKEEKTQTEFNAKDNIDEIKKDLLQNILEIMNWINPYISLEKEKNIIIKKIEASIRQNKIKESFEIFKSKIKELLLLIENLKNQINKKENEKIIPCAKKNKIKCDDDDEDNLNDKNNFLQLNATLLGIQNDLIQKIENKQEEIENIKKDLKNSIQLNNEFMDLAKNQKGQEVNVFAEKYKYLLDLLNSEQEKVKTMQNEYVNLLHGLSNYVNNGEQIVVDLKKMWNLNPVIKTNFEIADPEFPDIDPINETDLLTEKS